MCTMNESINGIMKVEVLWKYKMKEIFIIRIVMEGDWVVLSRSRSLPRYSDLRRGKFLRQWWSNWLVKVTSIHYYFVKGVPVSRVFQYSPEAPGNYTSFVGYLAFRFKLRTILREDRWLTGYLPTYTSGRGGIPPLPNILWSHCLSSRLPTSFPSLSLPWSASEIPKLRLEGLLWRTWIWTPRTQVWGLWHQCGVEG